MGAATDRLSHSFDASLRCSVSHKPGLAAAGEVASSEGEESFGSCLDSNRVCFGRTASLLVNGLNKGEAHHTLKRAIRFYRRGALPDRTQLEQDLHAMALNLVVAAITLWNTAYLDRALRTLEERGMPLPTIYLPHISPLGWEHIAITGTYQTPSQSKPASGERDRVRA